MNIDIICSDKTHPIYPYLLNWLEKHKNENNTIVKQTAEKGSSGDVLFLISCSQFIPSDLRNEYSHCFVIHASDLPRGRGWSPHVWQLLAGQNRICLSLIEADESIDCGKIWKKEWVDIPEHFDFKEICDVLFSCEIKLMDYALDAVKLGKTGEQQVGQPSYFPKRVAEDSMLDPHSSIIDQFNLLRVADPTRYPAYFDHLGHRYSIVMKKVKKEK